MARRRVDLPEPDGPEQRHHLPGPDLQRSSVESGHLAESDGDVLDREHQNIPVSDPRTRSITSTMIAVMTASTTARAIAVAKLEEPGRPR